VAIIEGNDTFATAATTAVAPTTAQLLTENEIMRIEMLYQSYTLNFGHAVGDPEILTDCSFVKQTLGVMGGGGNSDNTIFNSPRLEEDNNYYENETSYSPTS
jgi:S-adenosylhomocysteine hydrolase